SPLVRDLVEIVVDGKRNPRSRPRLRTVGRGRNAQRRRQGERETLVRNLRGGPSGSLRSVRAGASIFRLPSVVRRGSGLCLQHPEPYSPAPWPPWLQRFLKNSCQKPPVEHSLSPLAAMMHGENPRRARACGKPTSRSSGGVLPARPPPPCWGGPAMTPSSLI